MKFNLTKSQTNGLIKFALGVAGLALFCAQNFVENAQDEMEFDERFDRAFDKKMKEISSQSENEEEA